MSSQCQVGTFYFVGTIHKGPMEGTWNYTRIYIEFIRIDLSRVKF